MEEQKSILLEAEELINGDRPAVYGTAYENHKRIAELWSVVIGREVAPHEAALCMALVKVSRLVQSPMHRDSLVDLAGYAGVMDHIARSYGLRGADTEEVKPENG